MSAIEYQVDGSSRGVSDCISVMQDLPKEQHENGGKTDAVKDSELMGVLFKPICVT